MSNNRPREARAILVTSVRKALITLGISEANANTIVRPFSYNFATVTNTTPLRGLRWNRKKSIHSRSAWEINLPNSDFALKVYLGDESAGGLNTITITTPTDTTAHYVMVTPYVLGHPVNY